MNLNIDFSVFFITFKLAVLSTLITLALSIPLAWWLARTKSIFKFPINSIISLPIVLPPTVLGFYLLVLFSPDGLLCRLCTALGIGSLSFTFKGLTIGSVIYSMPFVIQPIQSNFESIPERYLEAASVLGARPIDRFLTVAIPLSLSGILRAAALGSAHTVGLFGVILMIGGNIPGKTTVMSTAIYNHVEAMEYKEAHLLSGIMIVFSFSVLMLIHIINKKYQHRLK